MTTQTASLHSSVHSLGDLVQHVVDVRASLGGADGVDEADLHVTSNSP
jgi:hypothetical protein